MNDKHQIFISSQMKHGTLNNERRSARKVIIRLGILFKPWDWEHDGPAGPRTPMEYCLQEVRKSYGLVLIVSSTLTQHTHKEYSLAKKEGKHLFIFFKKGTQRKEALLFRKELEKHHSPSWLVFRNTSELESRLYLSLQKHAHAALEEFKVFPSTKPQYTGVR